MPGRRCIQLLFEHAFIHRADRELGTAKHARTSALGKLEGELSYTSTDIPADLGGAISYFIPVWCRLAPLLGAVGIIHCHTDYRDWVVHSPHRAHTRDAPACP